MIHKYYEKRDFKVINIYTLSLSERLKYGAPINPFIIVTGLVPSFFNLKYNPLRKIELTDKHSNEFTRYIELTINDGELQSCKEFDSYDI